MSRPRTILMAVLGLLIPPTSDAAERDWPRHLATRDLLVEGRVISVRDSVRIEAAPNFKREVTLAISEVLAGVAPDTVFSIRVPRANDHLAIGEVVLAWGYRADSDAFRLHGGFVQISQDAERRSLVARVKRLRNLSPSRPFDRFMAACLVRVTGSRPTDENHYPVFRVEAIRWEIGDGHQFPREVVFHNPATNNCAFVEIGDTLLIPVTVSAPESVTLPSCPNSCLIHQGRLSAVNLSLEEFGARAIRKEEHGYVLRKILSEP
jgi:hypothetical protein